MREFQFICYVQRGLCHKIELHNHKMITCKLLERGFGGEGVHVQQVIANQLQRAVK